MGRALLPNHEPFGKGYPKRRNSLHSGLGLVGLPLRIGDGKHDQPVGSASSTAFGMNGGLGFTMRASDAPYRFLVESRHHYAPNRNISTQLATISFEVRY